MRRSFIPAGRKGVRKGMKLVIPPIYLSSIAIGLALAFTYAVLTAASVSREPDLRSFLTRTAYPAFITGGQLIAGGEGARLYDPQAQEQVQSEILAPYSYPNGLLPYNHLPFLAIALAGVAGWPLAAGYGAWLGATALALLAALVLLSMDVREAARSPFEAKWAVVALWALALGFFPVYHNLSHAQTAPWVLLGYTAALRLLRRRKEAGAGLALCAGLLKPQLLPLPLLMLLLRGRWRALAGFALLALVLCALATPLLGGPGWGSSYLSWLTDIARGGSSGNIQPALMENLRGFFSLLAARINPSGNNTNWVWAFTGVASMAYLLLLAWMWLSSRDEESAPAEAGAQRWQQGSAGWDLHWAATILGGLLLSPHLMGYELTLWLLAGVLIWRAARQPGGPQPRHAAIVLGAGYLMGTLSLPLIGAGILPLHLGALFMAGSIPLLIAWSRPLKYAARQPAGYGA